MNHTQALKKIRSLTDFEKDISLANLDEIEAGELLLQINDIATEALGGKKK
jgi:hypothetical protein